MILQLVKKELREVGWIAAVAVGLLSLLVLSVMGYNILDFISASNETLEIPFIGPAYASTSSWILVLLAVGLGLLQTLLEEHHGTNLFLLHRPARWSRILGIRLGLGIGICLFCALAPIVAYGWWAATPGNIPAPFEWSMVSQAVRMALIMPIVYLGAFLSGFRRARWIGTRLFPALAASAAGFLIFFIPQWWLYYPAMLLLMVLLIVQIQQFAKVRDYA